MFTASFVRFLGSIGLKVVKNSMIEGTIHQKKLKKIHEPQQTGDNLGRVGRGYFNRFMKRYAQFIDTKIPKRFALDKSEWLRPEYLEDMYDAIYTIFVEAGVARMVEDPIAYDMEGSQVAVGSALQYGLPSSTIIEHPEYILFGDETGINTNQTKDGNVGGARYIVPHGCVPLVQSNTCDHRATILPLTAATGDPVLCVVIFASEKADVESNWHTGIDITIDPILDQNGRVDLLNPSNYGPGKYFPSGPVCRFRDINIPTLTFTSPSATVTGEILVKIFTALDGMSLYPRGQASGTSMQYPKSCVVVDGHESRLNPSFLTYINNEDHKWNFALGVPYLTHLWQVGDSPEQNGSFKCHLSRAKEDLMKFKLQQRMTAKLSATDIIPLVNIAWAKSFAQVESNRQAVAARGWYPPTKKILQDPSLWDLQDQEALQLPVHTNSIDALCESTNLSENLSGSVIGSILTHAARKEGIKRRQELLVDGKERQRMFVDARKVTSGVLIHSGCYSCNDPIVLAAIKEREEKKLSEQREKLKRAKLKVSALTDQVKHIREKRGNDPENWNVSECKTFLQYKKRPGDPAMPNRLKSLQMLCKERMHRSSPCSSPVSSPCLPKDDAAELDE